MKTEAEQIADFRSTLAEIYAIARNGAQRRGMSASTQRARDLTVIDALACAALARNGPEITT